MIRFADYVEALDDDEIPDEVAAERMASIVQHWSDEEEEIIDFYLDKYMYTLDINALDQRIRRFRMAAEILSEKADELERRTRPKLKLVSSN